VRTCRKWRHQHTWGEVKGSVALFENVAQAKMRLVGAESRVVLSKNMSKCQIRPMSMRDAKCIEVRACARARVRACVRARVRVCVCVYVCVCVLWDD
jgi:hypothetical protein